MNQTNDSTTAREVLDAVDDSALDAPRRFTGTLSDYVGIASESFSAEASDVLLNSIDDDDVQIRPDGLLYLPANSCRSILNRAFGPGAWGLLPRSIETIDGMMIYSGQLFVYGRFVAEAMGEKKYPDGDRSGFATAAESAKSNCLVRCCKDIGIGSSIRDRAFRRRWIEAHAVEVWCRHREDSSRRRRLWRRRIDPAIDAWPWMEIEQEGGTTQGEEASRSRTTSVRPPAEKKEDAPPRSNGQARNQGQGFPISIPQVKRFRAIARSNKWKAEEVQALLTLYGFPNDESIDRSTYDRVVDELGNPTRLLEIRNELAQAGG